MNVEIVTMAAQFLFCKGIFVSGIGSLHIYIDPVEHATLFVFIHLEGLEKIDLRGKAGTDI
jgi:hypothetical protein